MSLIGAIRKQQLRVLQAITDNGEYANVAAAKADADQISGSDLLIKQDGTNDKLISDLTVGAAGTGADLVAIDGISGQTTVRGAIQFIEPGAKFIGAVASFASLPTASLHTNRVGLVFGEGGGKDGLYKSNGSTWDFEGAVLKRAGTGPNWYFDLDGIRASNMGTPTAAGDGATKAYVDSAVHGQKWADPVDYKANYVTDTLVNLSLISAPQGSYGFITGDPVGNGTLYRMQTGGWTAVTPVDGELVMLNGTTVPTGGVNADYVLKFITALGGWDYDDTEVTRETLDRRHSPATNEARIYKYDDTAYTYDDTTTAWVLSDSSGGVIGTRIYTQQNIVSNGQTITASLDALDIAIGDRNYTDGMILTDGETITASLEKLNLLKSTANGKGASMVGIEDVANYFTATTVEGALAELGAERSADNVKGTYLYKKSAGTDTAIGKLSFSAGTPTITIAEASNFANFTNFLAATGNLSWGTGSSGDYSATRSFLAAGFGILVTVGTVVQPIIQLSWNNSTKIFSITLDGNLKNKDLVTVELRREGYV